MNLLKWPRALVHKWRRSLQFRLVFTVLLGSLLVVAVLGPILVGRTTRGLLAAKEASATAEAAAGRADAQRYLDGANLSADSTPAKVLDNLTTVLAARGAQSELFDVALLSSSPAPTTTDRGTNQLQPESVPAALREAVVQSGRQSWTYTTILYSDGRSAPGLVVGAPLMIPEVGMYEVYHLFPLTKEEETLALVRSAAALGAGFLVLGMMGLGWIVTRQVVMPVRQVAESAAKLSSGDLDERVAPKGEDELAQLGHSFNAMADSMQDKIVRLQKLSVMQQRFVSDVSHELRTPLTTIQMAAHVLQGDEKPEFRERSAELLIGQIDRFGALLDDLLEISRFDAGAVSLDVEVYRLDLLLASVVRDLTPLAESNGAPMSAELVECSIECDQRRVVRILRNLIGNALKYGAGSPVEIRMVVGVSGVSVGVRDHGIGFESAAAEHVFDRFWREDPARARTSPGSAALDRSNGGVGGTGLGLAIAREDALLHGGRLDAWGSPGEGAHFVLTLPLQSGRIVGAPVIAPRPPDPADTQGRRRLRGRKSRSARPSVGEVRDDDGSPDEVQPHSIAEEPGTPDGRRDEEA